MVKVKYQTIKTWSYWRYNTAHQRGEGKHNYSVLFSFKQRKFSTFDVIETSVDGLESVLDESTGQNLQTDL